MFITDHNHGTSPDSTIPYKNQDIVTDPVHIGKGCWIGERVIILSGVDIGEKCVIGAGSVVTRSIPAYSMAAGNPAKVVK